jgi:hypothetical protein
MKMVEFRKHVKYNPLRVFSLPTLFGVRRALSEKAGYNSPVSFEWAGLGFEEDG